MGLRVMKEGEKLKDTERNRAPGIEGKTNGQAVAEEKFVAGTTSPLA